MKRNNVLAILCLLVVFCVVSCADETIGQKDEGIVEGIPVGVNLSIVQETGVKVTTRAALDEEVENKVYDIRLFVFNSQKKLEYTRVYEYEEPNTDKKATVNIPIGSITSGVKYIYAIANTTGGIGKFVDQQGEDVDLTKIGTVSDLQNVVSTLGQDTEQRLGDHLLMSGAYSAADGLSADGRCVIKPGATPGVVVSVPGSIKLTHADSRITFEISVKDKSISFVPKSWQVVNIPKKTYVLQQDNDYSSTTYFSSAIKPFDNTTIDGTVYQGGTFTFYMYENRKSAKSARDGSMISDYEDREREEKSAEGLNEGFKYADPQASYVILTGNFTQQKGGQTIKASVSYKIHLGYVNDAADDFKSKRNTIYKYKATIAGVENIILEVESSNGTDFKENQPGAEGKVVIADQTVSVDAHYEAKNITFYKDALSNLSVSVSTPFDGGGTYHINPEGTLVENSIADYKWVKFVRASDQGTLASYPGDLKSATMATDFVVSGDDKKHHLSIDQLLWQLYNKGNDDASSYWSIDNQGRRYVVYTVFVDEYYYSDKSFEQFVNADDRRMHILCDTKYSEDKQSTLTKANIMISQRSIKSIYNFNSSDQTGWGIESIDETPGMALKKAGERKETLTNGRYNTFKMLGFDESTNGDWSTYVQFTNTETNKLKRSYKNAEYACLQRNRDSDGDGKIDANEVVWYLPALNQYTGLWIGKDALEPEARLFQKDPTLITSSGLDGDTNEYFRANNHFMSSNGVRFWAEEGAATGNTLYDVTKSKFNFRCARNIGGKNDDLPRKADDVDDFVKPTISSKEVTTIDLSRIASGACRTTPESSMASSPEHTGADLNRPYKKFSVKAAVNKKCPAGYRVPNQRELALIAGYTTKDIGTFTSCTYSDLTYKKSTENGKIQYTYYISFWKNDFNIVSLSSPSGSMGTIGRCVKDEE